MGFFDFFKRKPAGPSQPKFDPREGLLTLVEEMASTVKGVVKVARLPDDFGLKVGRVSGGEMTLYLDNLFAETRELSPDEVRGKVAFFLAAMMESDDLDWTDARPMLLPVLRPVSGRGLLTSDGALLSLVSRPELPFLERMVAIDRPTSIAYVSTKILSGWGVPEAEVFEAAAQNVDRFDAAMEQYPHRLGPLFTTPGDNPYASSLLLVPGFLASFRDRVEGQPIAIIPERSTLFVGGDRNAELVRWLAEKARSEFNAAARSISPALYTVDDAGRVVPYEAVDASLGALVRLGHRHLAAAEYGIQKEALDKLHESKGVDVFVATASLVTAKEGDGSCLYCVWPDGIDALLPTTDAVVVSGGERNGPSAWQHLVPFDKVRQIAGGLMRSEPMALGPERYRVSGTFTAEHRAAFAAAETTLEALAR